MVSILTSPDLTSANSQPPSGYDALNFQDFEALLTVTGGWFGHLSANGIITYTGQGVNELLGLAPVAVLNHPLSQWLHPDDRQLWEAELGNAAAVCAATGGLHHTVLRFRHPSLGWRHFALALRHCADLRGLEGLLFCANDITFQVQARERIAQAQLRHLRFRELLRHLSQSQALHTRGYTQRVLETACAALGAAHASFWQLQDSATVFQCQFAYSERHPEIAYDWPGQRCNEASRPEYVKHLMRCEPISAWQVNEHPATRDFAVRYAERHTVSVLDYPVSLQNVVRGVVSFEFDVAPVPGDTELLDFAADIATLIAVSLEIARRREVEYRLEALAWYDPLTGLANRHLLQERLQQSIDQARQHPTQRIFGPALLLLDLDRFKDLNDSRGHEAGDKLLVRIAECLRQSVRPDDTVARMGGDEFVVIMGHLDHRDEAAQIARRILDAIRDDPMLRGFGFPVTTSLGIALYPEHGQDVGALLKSADAAMYEAKREGRDKFHFFNALKHDQTLRTIAIDQQLRLAVNRKELELHYQPLVDLRSGELVGLEALIRFRHPEQGYILPQDFIPIAEQTGTIEILSDWVLHAACRQIQQWREQDGFCMPVTINLSGSEFRNRSLPQQMWDAMRLHGVESQILSVEITERSIVDDNQATLGVLSRLTSMGISLIIDDFGVGYSSLAYLKRLPVSRIKLDRSFIVDLPADEQSTAIARAIISMAQQLKIDVVCEGIENLGQAECLMLIGGRYGQGYFFAPPMSANDLRTFCAQYQPRSLL